MSETAPLGITDAKFAENQTILCYQGPLIYEAKILEMIFKEDDGSYLYLVHYGGWNKKFDEWVNEDRCLEYTASNLKKQANTHEEVQNLSLKLKNKTRKVKHESQSSPSEICQSLQTQKDKSSSSDEQADVAHANTHENFPNLPIKKQGRKRKKEKPSSCDEQSDVARANTRQNFPNLPIKKRGRKRKNNKSPSSDEQSNQSNVTHGNMSENLSVKRGRTKEKSPDEESEKKSAEITIEKKIDSPIKKQEVKEEQQSEEKNQNQLKNEEQQLDQCQQNTLKQLVNSKVQDKIEKQGKHIVIPSLLKSLSTDDYIFINKKQMLFKLPVTITVEKIMLLYTQEKELHNEDHHERKAVDIEGLKEVFNMKLGNSLLYKFERPQYGDIIKSVPDLLACQVYGIPHLVRLLTQMEFYLKKHSTSDDMKRSRIICNDLIRYITENLKQLFTVDDYFYASAEYCRRAVM